MNAKEFSTLGRWGGGGTLLVYRASPPHGGRRARRIETEQALRELVPRGVVVELGARRALDPRRVAEAIVPGVSATNQPNERADENEPT